MEPLVASSLSEAMINVLRRCAGPPLPTMGRASFSTTSTAPVR